MSERNLASKAFIASTGLLAWGYFAAETGVIGETAQREAIEVAEDVHGVFRDRTEVRLGDTPLPKNIGKVASSTVEVRTTDGAGSGTVVNYRGDKLVITAAHVVQKSTNCQGEKVSLRPRGSGYSSATLQVISQTPAQNNKGVYKGGRDAVALRPSFWDSNYERSIPGLTPQAEVRLRKGDRVFSLGYGPRKGYDPSPTEADTRKQKPVVVPGVVVDVEDDSVTFMTGIGDSPSTDTKKAYPGDSGGTVVDASGKYIGGVVSVSVKPKPGWGLEAVHGLDLSGKAEDGNYHTSTAVIVDASTLNAMTDAMQPCN